MIKVAAAYQFHVLLWHESEKEDKFGPRAVTPYLCLKGSLIDFHKDLK